MKIFRLLETYDREDNIGKTWIIFSHRGRNKYTFFLTKKRVSINQRRNRRTLFPEIRRVNFITFCVYIEPVIRQICVQIRSMDQFEKLVEINIRSVSYQRDTIPAAYDSWSVSWVSVQSQPQVRIKLTYTGWITEGRDLRFCDTISSSSSIKKK